MKANNSLLISLFALAAIGCSDIDNPTTEDPSAKALSTIQVEEGMNPDDQILAEADSFNHNQAFLYTQGNETGINQIYMFRQNDNGGMEYIGKTATGGSGTGTPLNSQGSVVIDRDNGYLYLVNAGDNTISSFEIRENGTLSLMQVSPSEGVKPVSLAVRQGIMYVVHAESSSIAGFRLGQGGTFQHIPNSYRQLSGYNVVPGQIAFSPSGEYIYITETAVDKISRFQLSQTGNPGARVTIDAVGKSPVGIGIGQNEYLLVSNSENGNASASSLTSYSGSNTGDLSNVNEAVPNFQTSSGAITNTKHGFYSFVANNGSNSISSYYVRGDGSLQLVTAGIPTGVTPTDISLTADNLSAFVLCADQTIHSYLRLRGGNLHHTEKIATLSPTSTGLAIW